MLPLQLQKGNTDPAITPSDLRQICLRHTPLCPGKHGGEALIQTRHPYLETINEKTKLSAFLGLRSDRRAILIDKVDSAYGILAGAGIKAMLSQLSDEGIDEILARTELIKAIWAFGLTHQVPNRIFLLTIFF